MLPNASEYLPSSLGGEAFGHYTLHSLQIFVITHSNHGIGYNIPYFLIEQLYAAVA